MEEYKLRVWVRKWLNKWHLRDGDYYKYTAEGLLRARLYTGAVRGAYYQLFNHETGFEIRSGRAGSMHKCKIKATLAQVGGDWFGTETNKS